MKRKQPTRAHRERPQRREDDGSAFIPDPHEGPAVAADDLAQELAEEYLMAATSGEDVAQEERNADVLEDLGGPFVTSSGATEFAYDEDESNPADATREGSPSPMRGDTEGEGTGLIE